MSRGDFLPSSRAMGDEIIPSSFSSVYRWIDWPGKRAAKEIATLEDA